MLLYGPMANQSERTPYNAEYAELMNAVTALAVRCWLEFLERNFFESPTNDNEVNALDISDYEQAAVFFDNLKSPFVFSSIKSHILKQFSRSIKNTPPVEPSSLQKLTTELMYASESQKKVKAGSKKPGVSHTFSAATAGFGSGVRSLLMNDLLQRLYSEAYFSGFKASTTLAHLEFAHFLDVELFTGVVDDDNTSTTYLQTQDRSFDAIRVGKKDNLNGLSAQTVYESGYTPHIKYAGCVGLLPPSRQFREQHTEKCSNIPNQSAIAQLRTYLIPVVDNLIVWARDKGGTPGLMDRISPIDLQVLNGTHPNLPKHPETHSAPKSLID